MKCLLCSTTFDNDQDLIEHYASYHKIDPSNRFFQELFQLSRNCSIFCKSLRCDDFLITSDYKKKHEFLKHNNECQDKLFEDKPIDIEKSANLLKFEQ